MDGDKIPDNSILSQVKDDFDLCSHEYMLGKTEKEKKEGPGYFRAGLREYY